MSEKDKLSQEQEKFLKETLKPHQLSAYNRLGNKEKEKFWTLKGLTAKESFLGAPEEDRRAFMKGEMDPDEVESFLAEGGSLKMRTIGPGHVRFEQINALTIPKEKDADGVVKEKRGSLRRILIALFFICLSFDIYCNTFNKAQQLQLLYANSVKSDGKVASHPGFNSHEVGKLDNDTELIGVNQRILETTKTVDQYKTFITAVIDPKTMQCDVMNSLEESFMNSKTHVADIPRCKVDGENVWVGTYVATGSTVQPIFGVFHKGNDKKWQYENFSLKDFGLNTVEMDDFPTLTEKNVPQAFAHAFPEAGEEAEHNKGDKQ